MTRHPDPSAGERESEQRAAYGTEAANRRDAGGEHAATCPTCSARFDSSERLRAHGREHHR